jgi:hypothetical protein
VDISVTSGEYSHPGLGPAVLGADGKLRSHLGLLSLKRLGWT